MFASRVVKCLQTVSQESCDFIVGVTRSSSAQQAEEQTIKHSSDKKNAGTDDAPIPSTDEVQKTSATSVRSGEMRLIIN